MIKNTLVICPVYNEGTYLEEFYYQLRNSYSNDVLFVDDGSMDKGRNFLLKIKDKDTLIIRHPRRYGYGAALLSGFKFANDTGYKRIVTIDVDLQHNPVHISRFLRKLVDFDIVLGSRYIRIDRYIEVPRSRLIINKYISKLIKLLFGVYFTDPFCGFRGYRDSFLKNVCLKEQSYGLSLEILLEIIRTKISFKEIPIEAIYFNPKRKFLDGLDEPYKRLLYYLEIVSRKRRDIENEKKIPICESTS